MQEYAVAVQELGRYLELEGWIPATEKTLREQQCSLRERKADKEWKELNLLQWNEPGFFQRLLGRVQEKQEKARKEYNEAVAVYEIAKREMEALQFRLESAREEFDNLADAPQKYIRLCEEYGEEAEYRSVFVPAAIAAIRRAKADLEQARIWMQEDARYKGVRQQNRKMEFLSEAEAEVHHLGKILAYFPENTIKQGNYLKQPEGYITGVTSEFKQLDRLNLAQSQLSACLQELEKL